MVGFQPLNHNKQNCDIFPNHNHDSGYPGRKKEDTETSRPKSIRLPGALRKDNKQKTEKLLWGAAPTGPCAPPPAASCTRRGSAGTRASERTAQDQTPETPHFPGRPKPGPGTKNGAALFLFNVLFLLLGMVTRHLETAKTPDCAIVETIAFVGISVGESNHFRGS